MGWVSRIASLRVDPAYPLPAALACCVTRPAPHPLREVAADLTADAQALM